MPAELSQKNREAAHKHAAAQYGVKQGDLYIEAFDAKWGPVACGIHRMHPEREITRWTQDAEGHIVSWNEPDVHQAGQEATARPYSDEQGGVRVDGEDYPGYQPDCPLCADQVLDTFDHIERVQMEQRRAG